MQRELKTIDIQAADAVEFGRLERSLFLHAKQVGEGRYHISGGSTDHWVDLHNPSFPRCDCGDHVWRERVCKHILAALLREGNEQVIASLRDRLHELQQQLREFRKARRVREGNARGIGLV